MSFDSFVVEIFPDDADIETRHGEMFGAFARVTNITSDDIDEAAERVDGREIGFATIESGAGLGMELWME